MRIALDAHGGDHAPLAVVEGLRLAAKKWPNTTFVLIGQDDSLLTSNELPNIQFKRVSEIISVDDEPVKSVRKKRDSSLVVGCQLVKSGEVDAFISAGNTGALMAAGLFYTGRMKGVDRPALSPVFPTLQNQGILVLDVGANPEAKPSHLHQYALLGSIYAGQVLGVDNPKIGLLNIGAESGKGTALTKEAFDLIQADSRLNFIGNVEARDVLYRPCDVLVCDGFSGNILLKGTEGAAKAIFDRLKGVFTKNLLTKLAAGLLLPHLRGLKKEMDYKEHGGAPLLGLSGAVIKAHGSSDATAIFHAIRQARLFSELGVIKQMEQHLHPTEGNEVEE
jgi:glycerol-3-phosphate acyltransferase PlsX